MHSDGMLCPAIDYYAMDLPPIPGVCCESSANVCISQNSTNTNPLDTYAA